MVDRYDRNRYLDREIQINVWREGWMDEWMDR